RRRHRVDERHFMGLRLDHDRNMAGNLSHRAAPQIQAYGSRVRAIVTETAEQLMIARETAAALAGGRSGGELRLPIAVSARHVHLAAEAAADLVGRDYMLGQVI